MKVSKRWPVWLGIFVGLTTLSLAFSSSSTFNKGLYLATEWTGRVSFPLFIFTFSISSLATLFPNRWTKALLRQRRWWGLGYAACFAIHLTVMIVYKWSTGNFAAVNLVSNRGFLVSILLLAMVFTSSNAAQRLLGRRWKWLHRIGMWALLLQYSSAGLVYLLISLGAAGLRLISWMQKNRRFKQTSGRYS